MARLLCLVYKEFQKPLSHEMLWQWHALLFENCSQIEEKGKYRSHTEPMQIVSSNYEKRKLFFEAPPSSLVFEEMERFIQWFNEEEQEPSILAKASIAHLYFEAIHPFEDENGRIGRVLVEKLLSQKIGKPILIATSKVLEKRKKEYYLALGKCNCSLEAQTWIEFFSSVILQAQEESHFLKHFDGAINARQKKVLLRLFKEGPKGFQGGLSLKNYLSITKTTRATATRDLADLVKKKAFKKQGKLRYTRYYLRFNPSAAWSSRIHREGLSSVPTN
mgnify:CR=1 FL=1